MDRSERTLIPEWLKLSGSVTGSGYGNHQTTSFFHSDDHPISKHARNKSSANSRERDTSRSFLSDRTTSSYFRRNTSTKDSHLRSYSSFNRSHRDRGCDEFNEFTDKNKSILSDLRHHGDALSGQSGSDTLRRSQSLVTRKREATSSRIVNGDSSDTSRSNHIINSSLLLAGGSVQSSMQTAFGRDFPSLGTEQKPGSSELRRVPSPGLGAAVQSFSTSSSSMIGVDGWTSSLAEIPGLIGSNGSGNLVSPQAAASGTSAPLAQRANGLNMAEAVAQGPSRARTPPQASVDTQRLEELAIKQSRQLIPVIPSMPKAASLSPSDKLKPKTVQQQQSQILSPNQSNQNLRSGPARLDAGKTSNLGKLQFLKPSRELNGVSINGKESLSPKNDVKTVHSSLSPVKTLNLAVPNPEKKPLLQVQSRNDFFKLLKKKSSATNPPPGVSSEPSVSEKINVGDASSGQMGSSLESSAAENGCKIVTENGEGCKDTSLLLIENGVEHLDVPYPDEEEAAFLRSLGWEECAEEDEAGLTEEEIKAFYEYMKMRPTSESYNRVVPA